ncbi:SWIRM-domain-containing protein [Neoconidiobolus thromboides FSU 785]|nr:SWIRM-domain-containing protein [Neoconidiobolus thromboides FSU 785]
MNLNLRSGDVDWDYYDSIETLNEFQELTVPLINFIHKTEAEFPTLSAKDLSQFTASLFQFQEDNLGRHSNDDTGYPLVRINAKFFRPKKPNSILLFALLKSSFQYLALRKCFDWDFADSSKKDFFIGLLKHVHISLQSQNLIADPKIAFSDDVPQEKVRILTEKATKLRATVVQSNDSPTHIIHSAEQNEPPRDSDWYRVLDKRGDKALLHWFFYPDSHDAWVNDSSDYVIENETTTEKNKPIHVSARWLEDSLDFNEWMNEEDFLVDNEGIYVYDPKLKASKRKPEAESNENSDDPSKKHRADDNIPTATLISGADQVEVNEIDELVKVNKGAAKRAELEPIQGGEILNISSQIADDASMNKAPTVDGDEGEEPIAKQTHEIIIPSYSAWFDMDKINEIEERSLPEFFNSRNSSKTPTIYKEFRDFMINTYRLNPVEYLTVTACRRNLSGDVCAVIRVHAFLEQWGLINYQIDPISRPSAVLPPFTGHFRVTADTPRGLQPFLPSTSTNINPTAPNDVSSAVKTEVNHDLRRDIYERVDPPQLKAFNCATCNVDCSKIRYYNIKTKDVSICPNCYLEGRFPTNHFSGDFLKMEENIPKPFSNDDWNEQETLLLLEGIEMHQEDWDKVAEHVGSRDREQCILKFLQLPIEDPYLENNKTDDPLKFKRLPFSQADNPVMSVVAFLASAVNPGVASAAAQTALKELAKVNGKTEGHADNEDDQEIKNENGSGDHVPQSGAFSKEHLNKVASAALGSAAGKAKVLADYEEKEIQRLVYEVVDAQLQKLDLKLTQFEELETLLETERQELERQKLQVYLEYLKLKENIFGNQVQNNSNN